MKILCLIDSYIKPGDRWLWGYLTSNHDEVDFLFTHGLNIFPKGGKLLTYYPPYWQLAFKALRRIQEIDYDLVVAWEGKNGFPYAFLRKTLDNRQPPLIILSFSYRGLLRQFRVLSKFILNSVDHITVTTNFEVECYKRLFNLPSERISLCLLGGYDTQQIRTSETLIQKEDYILAAGRSYRDYATLARAVEGLDIKLIVLDRKSNLAGINFPKNVKTMDLLPLRDFWQLINQARFLVVPLKKLTHAAGDIHLVQAMSASKAVVATRAPSSETYVEQGITGLLVPPSNAQEMRQAISYLWQNPSEMNKMGIEARRRFREHFTFEGFAQRVDNILRKVYNEHN